MTSWSKDHVGKIHWSNYWHDYSLVLDVDLEKGVVTELDAFAAVNERNFHKVRRHFTALEEKDKFFTVEEFFQLFQNGSIKARDCNNADPFKKVSTDPYAEYQMYHSKLS